MLPFRYHTAPRSAITRVREYERGGAPPIRSPLRPAPRRSSAPAEPEAPRAQPFGQILGLKSRQVVQTAQPGAPERPHQARPDPGQAVEIAGGFERRGESVEILGRGRRRFRRGPGRRRGTRDGAGKGSTARGRRPGARRARTGPAREAETSGQAGEEILHRVGVGRGSGFGRLGSGGGASRPLAPLLGDAGGEPAAAEVAVGSCRIGRHDAPFRGRAPRRAAWKPSPARAPRATGLGALFEPREKLGEREAHIVLELGPAAVPLEKQSEPRLGRLEARQDRDHRLRHRVEPRFQSREPAVERLAGRRSGGQARDLGGVARVDHRAQAGLGGFQTPAASAKARR